MANEYVKFQRGSQSAYDALKVANKLDDNTLYFIYDDNNGGVGALYMGKRVISGGDITIASASLDDLADVVLSETGANSFLIKDDTSGNWISKSLEDVVKLIEEKLEISPTIVEDITNLQNSVTSINQNIADLEEAVNGKVDTQAMTEAIEEAVSRKADISTVNSALDLKANIVDVNSALDLKANVVDMNSALDLKADKTYVDAELDKKATIDSVNAALDLKADKISVDNELANKANKTFVDEELAKKANKTYVDEELAKKANASEVNDALALKANAADVYTKEETNNKITSDVNAAVASAAHLKRIKVEKLDDIDPAAENADQYIYMVPTGLVADDDKYDEYIVIDGAIEKVGSWEVNLSDYAKTEDVNAALATKVNIVDGSRLMTDAEGEKLKGIAAGAEVNIINAVNNEFIIGDNRELQINIISKDKITGLTEALADKVDKVEGSRLITVEEAKKLEKLALQGDDVVISGVVNANNVQELYTNVVRIVTEEGQYTYDGELKDMLNIAPGAEVNIINSASEEFVIDDNRKLSINVIDASKISNLTNNAEFVALSQTVANNASAIDTITVDVETNKTGLVTVNGRVDSLSNDFDAYKILTDTSISEIQKILTWKELDSNI